MVIATPHNALAEITLAAVKAGKHTLVEKPAACAARELEPILAALRQSQVCVRVGFNHRYHRAFQKAISWLVKIRFGRTHVYSRPLRARRSHRLR